MRLYKQELKRLFLARRTKAIFIIAITMSILLAVIVSGFNDANIPDEDGNIIHLHGRDAIAFLDEASSDGNGEVTTDRLKDALQVYHSLYEKYGTDPLEGDGFPLDVYWEQVYPVKPLLRIITIAYSTNESQVDLMSLKLSDLDNFYEICEVRLEKAMKSDDILNNPEYINKAKSLYANVEKPFIVSTGYMRDAFDYISITILLLVLFSAVMVAPVFSERYESGEDSVVRCTELGRGKLVKTTLLAVLTITSLMYLIGIGLHEEVKELWTMRDDDFIQSILALTWTGVRIGEFLQLRKSDVNLEEHYFTIPKGKTVNAERKVPIADAVYPFFEKWYHDGDYEYLFHTGKSKLDKHISYDKYLNDFKKLMKHLGWSAYTPHAARHTFNSLLADIDISNTVRAKLMGHAVGNVTETVYTHLDMSTLLDAVNKLECFIE